MANGQDRGWEQQERERCEAMANRGPTPEGPTPLLWKIIGVIFLLGILIAGIWLLYKHPWIISVILYFLKEFAFQVLPGILGLILLIILTLLLVLLVGKIWDKIVAIFDKIF